MMKVRDPSAHVALNSSHEESKSHGRVALHPWCYSEKLPSRIRSMPHCKGSDIANQHRVITAVSRPAVTRSLPTPYYDSLRLEIRGKYTSRCPHPCPRSAASTWRKAPRIDMLVNVQPLEGVPLSKTIFLPLGYIARKPMDPYGRKNQRKRPLNTRGKYFPRVFAAFMRPEIGLSGVCRKAVRRCHGTRKLHIHSRQPSNLHTLNRKS